VLPFEQVCTVETIENHERSCNYDKELCKVCTSVAGQFIT